LAIGALLSADDLAREDCDAEPANRSNALFSSVQSTESIDRRVDLAPDMIATASVLSSVPRNQMGVENMTRLAVIALICGASLLSGCMVSKEGFSSSEYTFIDNNCTGNGVIQNPAWCTDGLKASMGPYAVK
jgi:hypothetical protein